MYELEIRHSGHGGATLPQAAREAFLDPQAEVVAFSLIPWEEHCTECAMPACFSTCDLYEARPDGKCRRFAHGIVPVEGVPTLEGRAVRIEFKRWARLMAYANAHMVPAGRARTLAGVAAGLDRVVAGLPGSGISVAARRNLPARMQRRLKQWAARDGRFARKDLRPDYFLVEIYNPAPLTCRLTLEILTPGAARKPPYRRLVEAGPGFSRFKYDCRDIFERVDGAAPMHITLTPEAGQEDGGGVLYFGSLGFVADLAYRRQTTESAPVKVVVWDLDNTLWDGVLLEDGPDGIRLKPGIADVIRTLDSRGIVNSIASKNDHDHAMAQLERFGLGELFVFGVVGWHPKSELIRRILKDFNVGADSLVFIDDQPFERDEVTRAEPRIRALDATDYRRILDWPGFNPPRSEESAGRRQSYVTQRRRDAAFEEFSGDDMAFLRECGIELTIDRSAQAQAARLHELVQRTNQLNFSGRRYTRDETEALLADPQLDHFALSCRDRYGDYGVIAFAVVDKGGSRPTLRDLMMSCRVQSKRVEHAFLAYLMRLYRSQGFDALDAVYRPTERNRPAGRVFGEIGFTRTAAKDDVIEYRYRLTQELPVVDVVSVRESAR